MTSRSVSKIDGAVATQSSVARKVDKAEQTNPFKRFAIANMIDWPWLAQSSNHVFVLLIGVYCCRHQAETQHRVVSHRRPRQCFGTYVQKRAGSYIYHLTYYSTGRFVSANVRSWPDAQNQSTGALRTHQTTMVLETPSYAC